LIDENSIPNFEGRSFFKLIQILKMKYIIAGEHQAIYGSNLMKALYKEDVNANIRFWGGDLKSWRYTRQALSISSWVSSNPV
jgi:hypothetical protein